MAYHFTWYTLDIDGEAGSLPANTVSSVLDQVLQDVHVRAIHDLHVTSALRDPDVVGKHVVPDDVIIVVIRCAWSGASTSGEAVVHLCSSLRSEIRMVIMQCYINIVIDQCISNLDSNFIKV